MASGRRLCFFPRVARRFQGAAERVVVIAYARCGALAVLMFQGGPWILPLETSIAARGFREIAGAMAIQSHEIYHNARGILQGGIGKRRAHRGQND